MDSLTRFLHDVLIMTRDLVFLHCGYSARCTAVVDKRFDYHTLQLMTRGRVEVWYGRRREVMGPAAAWPAYPGPRVRFGLAEGSAWWTHRYAAFHGPRVERWRGEGLLPRRPIALRPVDAAELARMMDRVIAAAGGSHPLDTLRAGNTLEAVLLRLAGLDASPGAGRFEGELDGPDGSGPWLAQVLARLDDVDQPDPDYARLAAEHAMALNTLRRRFRRAVGVPLHAYRLSRKMAEARRLLADTGLTLQDLADRLGYRDVYYFSRQFAAEVGVPPGRYRRSRQGDGPSARSLSLPRDQPETGLDIAPNGRLQSGDKPRNRLSKG